MRGSSEPDVAADPHLARTRQAGGAEPNREHHPDDERADPDGPSTTGTDENEEFVGGVAGQDAGYAAQEASG